MDSNLPEQNVTPQQPSVSPIGSSHHYVGMLVLTFVLFIVAAVSYYLYSMMGMGTQSVTYTPEQTSPAVLTPKPFTPVAFLENCGVTNDFVENANKNSLILDARVSGSFKGVVGVIAADSLELKEVSGSQTLTVPLSGKGGTIAQTERIVYSSPSAVPVALSTLKSGQTVTVAYICRPKVERFQFVSPAFEVVNILINQ